MLLTRECDYGIRIIRALSGGEKRTMKDICDLEHIPGQYAYRIIKKLERTAFLRVIHGRGGGYQLEKSLDSFTLYDVIIAIDENLFVFECLRNDKFCPFKTAKQPCAVHEEFKRIQNRLIDEMRQKPMSVVLAK